MKFKSLSVKLQTQQSRVLLPNGSRDLTWQAWRVIPDVDVMATIWPVSTLVGIALSGTCAALVGRLPWQTSLKEQA